MQAIPRFLWPVLILTALGAIAALLVFAALLSVAGWRGFGHVAMLAFLLLAVAAGGLIVWKRASWPGALLILSGLGYFFSYMLTYADNTDLLGTYYPLALFAAAPWCVAGAWLGTHDDGATDASQA